MAFNLIVLSMITDAFEMSLDVTALVLYTLRKVKQGPVSILVVGGRVVSAYRGS